MRLRRTPWCLLHTLLCKNPHFTCEAKISKWKLRYPWLWRSLPIEILYNWLYAWASTVSPCTCSQSQATLFTSTSIHAICYSVRVHTGNTTHSKALGREFRTPTCQYNYASCHPPLSALHISLRCSRSRVLLSPLIPRYSDRERVSLGQGSRSGVLLPPLIALNWKSFAFFPPSCLALSAITLIWRASTRVGSLHCNRRLKVDRNSLFRAA